MILMNTNIIISPVVVMPQFDHQHEYLLGPHGRTSSESVGFCCSKFLLFQMVVDVAAAAVMLLVIEDVDGCPY